MYRGCAAERSPSQHQSKRCLEHESMGNTVVEEAWRQICLAQRQRGMERAGTRGVFALGRVVS